MPLIRVDAYVIDANNMRCGKTNIDGTRCQATAGNKGIVEIAILDNGDIKLDVTCGTHINKRAGDDVRYYARRDAIENGVMINAENAERL